jgi:A/G-specific adenine glycosylase
VAQLEGQLRPLGLHRRRADVLHRLASSFVTQPELPLVERPGVGQYVARAVAVAGVGTADAMVDVNFVRILKRVFGGPWKSDYRYDQRLQGLAHAVVQGATNTRTVNWGVLDLAAMVCNVVKPRCASCPIIGSCEVGRQASRQ